MPKMSDLVGKTGRDLTQPLPEPERREPMRRPVRRRRPQAPRPEAGDRDYGQQGYYDGEPEPAVRPRRRAQPPRQEPGGFGGGMPRVERERLVSQYAPSSPEGKRIDILRSQLLYPFHGDPPRTIMITSAVPHEGRSLLAANLAISFARGLQQYVMVMDCHVRYPAIHNLLGVPRRPGITDFLEHGSATPDIMHWSLVEKLSVIPAGSPSYRSAELLATDKMAALVEELRARYADRYIILDTPPVEAVDDPAVLARMVEGIVFVVMAGSTDRETALRAMGRLPEDKIIGVVMNDKNATITDASGLDNQLYAESMS